MKLTIVTDQWNPHGGGRERYLAELAERITADGYRVQVLCLRDRSTGAPAEATTVTEYGGPRIVAERRLDHAIGRLRASNPTHPVLAARPQIGATHYQLHSGLYREAFSAERESMTSPLRRWLFWPTLRLNRHRVAQLAAERRMLAPRSEARLMTFAASLGGVLTSQLAVPAERVCISPPGVDLVRFSPTASRPPSHSNLRLLFCAHDFVLKGLETAITALAECRRSGIDALLTVAGGGRAARFVRLAARESVTPAVRFLGPVSQAAMAELYQRSHVLIHPSHYDPFSRVVLEALAAGCPVVATRRCGATELMENGVHGQIIERPDDAIAFAAACRSLTDPTAWRGMSEAAITLARARDFSAHAADVHQWLLS